MSSHRAKKGDLSPTNDCGARLSYLTIILDQAPPTLILGVGLQSYANEGPFEGAHDEFDFVYRDKKVIRRTVRYRWKADIVGDLTHFRLFWIDDEGQCWSWDGLANRSARVRISFEGIRKQKAGVGARIFDRIDMSVGKGASL